MVLVYLIRIIGNLGPNYTIPKKFEKRGFTLKRHEMSTLHWKNLRTQQSLLI